MSLFKFFFVIFAMLSFPVKASSPVESEKNTTEQQASSGSSERGTEKVAIGVSKGKYDTCLPDPVVLSDLSKRKNELDAREKTVSEKEAELAAKSNAIQEELSKLELLKKEILGIKQRVRDQNAEKIAKMIETIEGMSPSPAAKLLAELDTDLAVPVIEGLSNLKLSKILSKMDIQNSKRLSELMALGRTQVNRTTASKEKEGTQAK